MSCSSFPEDARLEARLLCTCATPDSVLRERSGDVLLQHRPSIKVGSRSRVSTCSDATWLDADTLVAVNLNGQSLDVYRLDRARRQLVPIQKIHSSQRLGGVDRAPDGKSIVVTHATPGNSVALYRVEGGPWLAERPFLESSSLKSFVHSARFTPDGRFILVARFAAPASLLVLDAASLGIRGIADNPLAEPACYAKASCMAVEDDLLFVSWANNFQSAGNVRSVAYLSLHRFDALSGQLSQPLLVRRGGFENLESLDVFGAYLVGVDQVTGAVQHFLHDAGAGRLSEPQVLVEPDAAWSSPHGVAISPTGREMAVTEHVNDSLRVYSLERSPASSSPSVARSV